MLFLYGANVFLGDLNQDEGWYLYAAKLVGKGEMPYVDFAFTQGPLMPYVYSLANPMVERWGVAGGRCFTMILGIAGTFLAALLAARLAPPGRRNVAAIMAFSLVGINVYQTYFTSVVKTYALAGLLITLGYCMLVFAWESRSRLYLVLAGAFLAMAAGTRFSAAVVAPVVVVGLLAGGVRRHLMDAAYFIAGYFLVSVVVFLPFFIRAPDALWFALYEYHSQRSGGKPLSVLAGKAGFISRVAQAYFVAAGAFVAIVLYRLFAAQQERLYEKLLAMPQDEHDGGDDRLPERSLILIVWASIAIVSLVHLLTPFPYDDYQVVIYPLAAAAVARMLSRIAGTPMRQAWLAACVFLLCVGSAFSSPINQKWFVTGRDRIWWPLKTESPLAKLHRVGAEIRRLAQPGATVLTQDPYIAVEAGLNLPPGLEMGPFSYFPDLDTEKAGKLRVLNGPMLCEVIMTTDARVAAFSEFGFAIKSPEVVEVPMAEQDNFRALLEDRYSLVTEEDCFGQGETKLKIYRIK